MSKTDRIPRFEYVECDICATKCRKRNTVVQKGLRRCPECIDYIKKYQPLNMRWGAPRTNSTTVTPVNSSTIFSITAAGGITLSNSVSSAFVRSVSLGLASLPDYVFFGASYYMLIVGSGGAINITADPQIAAGNRGDLLVLKGTSDTNTVLLEQGTGINLIGGLSMTISNGDMIVFSFDGTTWNEGSRHNEPEYS